MRRSQFASLIGVTKQQVSKYNPYLVMDGDQVLVDQSLAALEGHLDETKRQAALAVRAQTSGARQSAPAAASAPAQRSAKAEKEEIELALKRLEYGKQAGELVYAADVDAAARQAVQELREQAHQGHRETADGICTTFGLAPEKAVPLQRLLARRFEELMGRFAANMAVLADAEGVAEPSESEIDADELGAAPATA